MSIPDPMKLAIDRLRAAERAVADAESELIAARRGYESAKRLSPYWKELCRVNQSTGAGTK